MDLICYLHSAWRPLIRPAAAARDWMTATPESFAYRCLPLDIANAHGWELLNPCRFDARWMGGSATSEVEIQVAPRNEPSVVPVSLFGQGVVTFHVPGLFRTPPGWNLWVGGSPNQPKDGIYPLTGIVETDWAPYTFTMNWRFTRRNHWVRFEEGEPICFFFPIQRGYLDDVTPKLLPLESDAETKRQFEAWSRSRNEFHARMAKETPSAGSEKWQKNYYRGMDIDSRPGSGDHQTRLHLKPFTSETDAQAKI